ncbi:MAG: nicotinate phosphoribosyltransferase, partial [Terriglobia bacterium]
MPQSPRHSALLTDLYELTMAAAYFENRIDAQATFELFVRNLPPERGFLLAAGLEQVLDFLQTLTFTPADI